MKIGRKLFLGGKGDEKLSHNPTDVLMTSGVILKKRIRVQELQIMGYTQEKIAKKLGTSVRTVQRAVEWIRRNEQNWLDDIAKTNFVNVFRETLEGYKQDIVRLYEMLEQCKDDNTKIKIIKAISDIRYRYTEQFARFPAEDFQPFGQWMYLFKRIIPTPLNNLLYLLFQEYRGW